MQQIWYFANRLQLSDKREAVLSRIVRILVMFLARIAG
jgi:hypothetical protein